MHIPVLLKEVINYLNPKPNENFIDVTVGEGGHALNILQLTGPNGKLLGIDLSKEVIETLTKKRNKNLEKRLILINDSYINLEKIVKDNKFHLVQGILFDLGVCSWHLDRSGKGFSFKKDEPLDMRFDSRQELTAAEIINFWDKKEIERILKEYGEERYASRIAIAISEFRKKDKIISTQQLVNLLAKTLPRHYDQHRIHFATRTFQALRIAVNNELENIEKGLRAAVKIIRPKGKLVIISFHSLEDRIVKNFFKQQEKIGKLQILTKKPISPTLEEIQTNSRSRSAKLRAGQIN